MGAAHSFPRLDPQGAKHYRVLSVNVIAIEVEIEDQNIKAHVICGPYRVCHRLSEGKVHGSPLHFDYPELSASRALSTDLRSIIRILSTRPLSYCVS